MRVVRVASFGNVSVVMIASAAPCQASAASAAMRSGVAPTMRS
jgi:hypothetical protein